MADLRTSPSHQVGMEKMEKLERRSHMASEAARFSPSCHLVKLLPGYRSFELLDPLRIVAVVWSSGNTTAVSRDIIMQ